MTTGLIQQYNGDTKNITSRMIAEKAGVGLGLINYHFGSKENLITECVQRIIGKVVTEFQMTENFETDKERLTSCAICVFNFLFENSAISRISILGDFQNYTANCNSVLTQLGFSMMVKNHVTGKNKSMLMFILTAAMQTAFLGSETVKQLLGYDFEKPEDRASYIRNLVNILFNGMEEQINE
ncbi:MAG: TetR/AcrR family transcriptional regulator [Ruminococcus sp.]|nr:TetR/AcrR family transcriptional regulator [Ruminococcus sp.]MDD6448072.1 TetR/AcrR family transcriptional regulator [Ruminococcus sp.]MDY2856923.1 TetR/AcrR family transcriptional regulator [Oscillospiraceae bacterium]